MRHGKYKYRLNMDASHRKLMVRNLIIEVIDHGKIKTTFTRCKAIKGSVEKLVTLAKKDTLANRRLALKKLNNNKEVVKKLFENIAPKFVERKGGYTRIVKVADLRVGDAANVAFISFVE